MNFWFMQISELNGRNFLGVVELDDDVIGRQKLYLDLSRLDDPLVRMCKSGMREECCYCSWSLPNDLLVKLGLLITRSCLWNCVLFVFVVTKLTRLSLLLLALACLACGAMLKLVSIWNNWVGTAAQLQAGFLLRKTADFVTTPTNCSWQHSCTTTLHCAKTINEHKNFSSTCFAFWLLYRERRSSWLLLMICFQFCVTQSCSDDTNSRYMW